MRSQASQTSRYLWVPNWKRSEFRVLADERFLASSPNPTAGMAVANVGAAGFRLGQRSARVPFVVVGNGFGVKSTQGGLNCRFQGLVDDKSYRHPFASKGLKDASLYFRAVANEGRFLRIRPIKDHKLSVYASYSSSPLSVTGEENRDQADPSEESIPENFSGDEGEKESDRESIKDKAPSRKVGSFQHIPNVPQSSEIISSAIRKMKSIKPTKGIMNAAKREKNKAAKQLDFLIKEVSSPLGVFVRKFPQKKHLHPYEHSVLELTLGEGNYEKALEKVNNLRKRILNVGKNACGMIGITTTKKEAEDKFTEGVEKITKLYDDQCYVVDELKEIAKKLRSLPVIHPKIPTLCLVGPPNVGKSSLVKVLSTAKPEICNYPFTTRSISMGHIFIDSYRFQVTDTPGILLRPDEDRNDIEKLTIAALTHLPSTVLFVHDLTENCGMKVKDQYSLYLDMKHKFGNRPWMDVVSKSDLLPNHNHDQLIDSDRPSYSKESISSESELTNVSLEHYAMYGPAYSFRVSTETGEGLESLKQHVYKLLIENRSLEKGHENSDDSDMEEKDLDIDVKIRSNKSQMKKEFYFPPLPKEMLRGV